MLQPKPNIEKLAPGTHGGIDYSELGKLGISPETVLDFSVSTNPLGPPPEIGEALSSVSIENYPDSEATELGQSLTKKLNITPDSLLIGSGSTVVSCAMAQSATKRLRAQMATGSSTWPRSQFDSQG